MASGGGGITALTGDVTASGTGSVVATIADDAVTYAKMQNTSAASVLLGRGAGAGAGNVQELTLGSGLSLSGTTLSATGIGMVSGTTNYVAKFTGASAVGNSQLFDNGTNVGIGTVSPAQKLTLSDGTSTVFLLEKTGGSAKNWYITNSAASAQTFGVSDETTYRLVINNVGNVGIGTTSPDRSLVVKASGGLGGAISVWPTTDSTEASIRFTTTAAGGGNTWYAGQGVWGAGAGNFAIGETANRLTILAGGNVGIGTTAPGYKLHVAGQVYAGGPMWSNGLMSYATGASGIWRFGACDATGDLNCPANGAVIHQDGVTTRLAISSSGNVGIGTTSPSYKLHVDGQVAGNAAYVNTSDGRLKKDVADLDYGLETVMRLRPVSFQWKRQSEPWSKGRKLGLIAQEVEKIAPEVVSTASDDMHTKSIAYGDLTPVIIKAVQELKADNDRLRVELKASNDNDGSQNAAIDELRREIDAFRPAR